MIGFSWNLLADTRQLLSYHFMLNALRAGTIVAIVAGLIGYFMVLRRQSFAGHTLAVVGFPGAAGATWLGINPAIGFFGFCIAAALAIAALPSGRSASGVGGYGDESAVIGTLQAFALACGFLFVSLYGGFLSGLNNLLFGSITGVSDSQVLILLGAGALSLLILAVIGRRLLFITVDPQVASARGVRVGTISAAFLLLLGIAAAGTSQVTGSLLVFALLVAPAATAVKLTARPGLAALLSVLLAVAVTWAGEAAAFYSPYPIGFWVSTFAFALFLAATAYRAAADRLGRRATAFASAAVAPAAAQAPRVAP
ncbi:MAG TPA: metal ABC transporter permease [Jatrophihabitans sp.]|jgi:zinc/manganese transport system permease protein